MLKSLSHRLVLRGALAMVLGAVAVIWPGITLRAFVIVFAVFAFVEAMEQAANAFSSDRPGPVVGHLLLALLDVAAGVVALVWPGITAFALVICVAAWAVVTGAIEFGMAFLTGETAGERALWAVAGAILVLFGIVMFAHPNVGALSLALVFGICALAVGISDVALGINIGRTGKIVGNLSHGE